MGEERDVRQARLELLEDTQMGNVIGEVMSGLREASISVHKSSEDLQSSAL